MRKRKLSKAEHQILGDVLNNTAYLTNAIRRRIVDAGPRTSIATRHAAALDAAVGLLRDTLADVYYREIGEGAPAVYRHESGSCLRVECEKTVADLEQAECDTQPALLRLIGDGSPSD